MSTDEFFHVGDIVKHKASGKICRVDRFAHDGTTDFLDDEGTGPYKQSDFEIVQRNVVKSFWDS